MGKHKPRIKVKAEPKTVAPSHVAACALAVVVSLLIAWHLGPSPADGLIRVTLEDEEGAAGLQLRGFGSSYPEVASVTAGSAVATVKIVHALVGARAGYRTRGGGTPEHPASCQRIRKMGGM